MATLKILSGERKNKVWELKPNVTFTIGRDPGCTLTTPDKKVSHHHAEIYLSNDIFFIKDLKSSNGTLLNGTRVTQCSLKHNDRIQIGNLSLIYEETSASDVKAPEAPAAVDNKTATSTVEIKLDFDKESTERIKQVGKEVTSPRLASLYRVSKIISAEKDLNALLKQMLKLLVESTKADQGYIFFWDKTTDKTTARMMYPKEVKEMKISRTIVKRVAQYTRPLLTGDAMLDARLTPSQSVVMGDIKSVICVPMISTPKGEGVIYLESDKIGWSFAQEDLEFTTIVALQVGLAFVTFSATEKANRVWTNTIKTLVMAGELNTPRNRGHAERVANYAAALAANLGLGKAETQSIRLAGQLHDVGKIIQTPEGKTGEPPDAAHKKEHVLMAEKILKEFTDFEDIVPLVKYHHERVDGTGFPEGLKGDKIPLGARIIAVANILDNLMTYGGPGKEGLPVKEALGEIKSQEGKEFDGKVVAALFTTYEKDTLFGSAAGRS